jgi:hypothetical protein
MIEKGLEEERNHRLGACKKTLKKAMWKKKSGKEWECQSILRGAKWGFNWRKI